jgi:hypothetical protein
MESKRKQRRPPAPARPPAPHRHERSDDGNAFIPDPDGGPAHTRDDLSERLAEDYVAAATSGEEPNDDNDETFPEEIGGPFVETSAAEELADGTDEANPSDATREPLPRAVAADSTPGRNIDELNNPPGRNRRR